MTDLDRLRVDLKRRIAKYDPSEPLKADLMLQVINDLAMKMGTDAAYILELFEQITDDTAAEGHEDESSPEAILKTLFETLAPYQSGVYRPTPIQYVAAHLPSVDGVQINDLIREFAIAECGWPMGTHVGLGSRFELNYSLKDRRAYVLNAGPDTYLIPRYDEALSRHIEKRDSGFAGVHDEEDEEGPFYSLGGWPPGPGAPVGITSRCAIPSFVVSKTRAGKRGVVTAFIDEAIDKDKTIASVHDREGMVLVQEIARRFEAAESVRVSITRMKAEIEAMADLRELDVALGLEPDTAAPVRPARAVRLPGHSRSPERRSRAPPGRGN